jgi:hypothetical protein
LFDEKIQRLKISWHCPSKDCIHTSFHRENISIKIRKFMENFPENIDDLENLPA